ncbi:hypothetical protein VXQ18_10925 [Brucella abortus]|nr:hypothetical protein [Brucella abortus]
MLCARARAPYEGRLCPSVDDVKALAEPVLQHRMALNLPRAPMACIFAMLSPIW